MIDFRVGIESASSQIAVTDNDIAFTGPFSLATYGVLARGPVTNLTISGNTLAGNSAGGESTGLPPTSGIVLFTNADYYGPTSSTAKIDIANNTISGFVNGMSVYDSVTGQYGNLPTGAGLDMGFNSITGNSAYGVRSGTGELTNSEDNWWGSANGPTHTSNTFNVGSQGDAVSDNVDFVPWLNAAPPTGVSFAPVTTTNPEDSYASIQAGVDGSNAGGTVNAKTGTFDEQVVIGKGLTLQGAGDTTVIKPSSAAKLATVLNGHYAGERNRSRASSWPMLPAAASQ
jgi:hypothetical protein